MDEFQELESWAATLAAGGAEVVFVEADPTRQTALIGSGRHLLLVQQVRGHKPRGAVVTAGFAYLDAIPDPKAGSERSPLVPGVETIGASETRVQVTLVEGYCGRIQLSIKAMSASDFIAVVHVQGTSYAVRSLIRRS